MKRSISLYPQLSKKHTKFLKPDIENLRIYYRKGEEIFDLNSEGEREPGREMISVRDDRGEWSAEEYGFECEGDLTLDNVDLLFDTEEEGIVSENAIIGVGLQWKSKSSNARGSQKVGELTGEDEDVSLHFDSTFLTATLRNSIDLTFVLYLISPGDSEQEILPGTILGDLFTLTIVLEGQGSIFTVFEKNAPGEPLWSVECDWEDPEYSQFAECVRVTVNTGHNAWQLATDDDVRKELLKEIMASSMQIIISELEPYQYDGSGDYEPGSVSAAIRYFVTRADINTDSNAGTAKSVRAYLDKAMK